MMATVACGPPQMRLAVRLETTADSGSAGLDTKPRDDADVPAQADAPLTASDGGPQGGTAGRGGLDAADRGDARTGGPDAGGMPDAATSGMGGMGGGSSAGTSGMNAGGADSIIEGLVGWWKFNEAAGSQTATDSSPQHNDGKIFQLDPNLAWAPGRIGGALDCTGRGGVLVESADSLNQLTSSFSVAVWAKLLRAPSGYSCLVSRQEGTGGGEHYFLGLGEQLPQFFGDVGFVLSKTPLSLGVWVHMAATFDGTALRLYLDGTQTEMVPVNNGATIRSDASRLAICGNQNDPSGFMSETWPGLIDDLRIYKRALSSAEVAALAR